MSNVQAPPQEFSGRLAPGKDWREVVAWVGDLPPMPQVASRAICLVENPDTSAEELTNLLSSDTALAARVLKIANSAMFCRQREITTLKQAIMIIGFKALKGIIVAATLRQINKRQGNLDQLIWEKSMGTAMFATSLATQLRKPYREEIFLMGLLHSLGQVVFLAQKDLAADYEKVFKAVTTDQVDYVSAEQEIMGFAHPLIGALVAKKWNFSAETCQIILHYRDPLSKDELHDQQGEKTAVVQMAELMSHAAGIGSPEGYPAPMEEITRLGVLLGFREDTVEADLNHLIEDIKKKFEAERHIYS